MGDLGLGYYKDVSLLVAAPPVEEIVFDAEHFPSFSSKAPSSAAWPKMSAPADTTNTTTTTNTAVTAPKAANPAANDTVFPASADAAKKAQVDDTLRELSDVLVVDSAGFIKNCPLQTLGKELFTIREVVHELRDKVTRDRMAGPLPYELTFREPSLASMTAGVCLI